MAPTLALHDPDQATPWDDLWESFDRELAIKHADKTRSTYRRCADAFTAWLGEHGRPLDPAQVTRDDVVRFFGELRGRLQPAGVRLHWAALGRFFNWLVSEDELVKSPMARLERPSARSEMRPYGASWRVARSGFR